MTVVAMIPRRGSRGVFGATVTGSTATPGLSTAGPVEQSHYGWERTGGRFNQ